MEMLQEKEEKEEEEKNEEDKLQVNISPEPSPSQVKESRVCFQQSFVIGKGSREVVDIIFYQENDEKVEVASGYVQGRLAQVEGGWEAAQSFKISPIDGPKYFIYRYDISLY